MSSLGAADNLATGGGGFLIDGHMETIYPRQDTMTVLIKDCVFWKNYAKWVGGAFRILNAWPAHITLQDSKLLDNYALIGHDHSLYNLGQNVLPEGFMLQGNTSWNWNRVYSSGLHLDPLGMNGGFLGLIYTHFNAALGQPAAPDANTNINVDTWIMYEFPYVHTSHIQYRT
eukprot:SAG31_NODE_724_length_12555_cov_11.624277_12_plen_172_part_00